LFDHGFGDDHFAIGIIEKAFLLDSKLNEIFSAKGIERNLEQF
jgi:hypothetical protein